MQKIAYLLVTLSALFWSGNFVIGRALAGSVDPVALNFWRWVLALLVLAPLSFRQVRADKEVLRAHWRLVLILGTTGIALFHTLVYAAVTYTSAINTLLLAAISPVLIVIFSWLLFRDRINRLQAFGIMVSLTGAVVLISKGDLSAVLRMGLGWGEMLAVSALVVWSFYSSLLKRRPAAVDPLALLTASVVAGVLVMAPFYAFGSSKIALTLPVVSGLAYIVLFASVLGFVFWSRGVAVIGPNRAGVFLHLMPVFGSAMSVTFLGETIAAYHLIGAALVLLGIVVASPGPARMFR
jgi:drug/metabolite transporter (DMT)-like permease